MIDLASEHVFPFPVACGVVPARRRGKKLNIATLYRWTTDGVRGIRLEYLMVGATRCTSAEALQRFFNALTAQAESSATRPPATSPARLKAIKDAERRLEAAGI